MQIACPNCATTYQVADASLGASGRSVRCVRCRNVWFATNPAALAAIARDHRSDVAAFTASTSIAGLIADPHDAEPDPPAEAAAPDAAAAYPEQPMEDSGSPTEELPPAEDVPIAAEAAPDLPDDNALQPPAEIEGPALERTANDLMPATPETLPGEDIESIAARHLRRPPKRKHKGRATSGLATAILVLVAINTALIAWRSDVVRWAPQTAGLYAAIGLPVNLRGLVFKTVTTTTESHEGVQVLVVEGTIASVASRVVEVPRLRFSMRNASGNEIYAWTALPTRSLLPPGETLAFRSRLASPPRDGHEVLVRFFNRRDLVAGIQ